MSYKNRLLEKLNLPTRAEGEESTDSGKITEMMMNPNYLNQSSTLINQALRKGFDVLQMEDGEIVMTGTKTIVYRYKWDATQGALVKQRVDSSDEDERLNLPDMQQS